MNKTIMLFIKTNVQRWNFANMVGCVFLFFLTSCNQLTSVKMDWNIETHKVHNIYGAVDMSLFHGFESKVTVDELRAKHGEPSRVLDAKDVAEVDGYDIWEYDVQNDKIDCYIKKGDNVVDYIYSEFTNPKDIHSIVKDRQLADEIIKGNTFADFIVDDFKSTIRILKQRNSANYAVNMAIDDNEELVGYSSLRDELERLSNSLPLTMGELCDISSCSYDNHIISINCDVNDSPNCDLIAKMKNDPDFGNQCVVFFFGYRGVLSNMASEIVKEKACINLTFKGKVSKATTTYKVNASELMKSPTTAMQKLKAAISFDNMGMVNLCNDEPSNLRMAPREMKNNVLYISMTYLTDPIDVTDDYFKDFITKSYLNNANPDQDIFITCAQSGVGVSYMNTYVKDGKQKTYTANFTNSELKALRTRIK